MAKKDDARKSDAPVLSAEEARQASIALETRRQKILVLGILGAVASIPFLVILYFIMS